MPKSYWDSDKIFSAEGMLFYYYIMNGLVNAILKFISGNQALPRGNSLHFSSSWDW